MNLRILPLLLLSLLAEAGAQVQTGPRFVVTTLTDRNNATALTGNCSLREAIRAATASGQPATIVFAPELRGTATLSAALGQLSLGATPISILGPGARVMTISGGAATRVFATSGGPHLITGLSIANGKVSANNQGGGGLWNQGNLVVQECTIIGNQAQSPTGSISRGGGIFNSGGSLTLVRSTVTGNSVKGTDAANGLYGDNALGGGVHVSGGTFTALSSTFQGNTAQGSAGSSRSGRASGGIHNDSVTILRNCTVTGNDAKATNAPAIGGIFSDNGTSTLFSTVVAGNTAAGFARHRDVRGSFSSEGYNLIGMVNGYPANDYPVSAFSDPTDLTGNERAPRDAKLGSLQNNGGQTDTMLPLVDSQLIDQGKTTASTLEDQRGRSRLVDKPDIANAAGGDGSDIGAVEFGAPAELPVVEFTSAGAIIRLKGEHGMNHTFEYSDDLEAPWTAFGGTVSSDGAGNLTVLDPFNPGPQPPKRFYRAVPVP